MVDRTVGRIGSSNFGEVREGGIICATNTPPYKRKYQDFVVEQNERHPPKGIFRSCAVFLFFSTENCVYPPSPFASPLAFSLSLCLYSLVVRPTPQTKHRTQKINKFTCTIKIIKPSEKTKKDRPLLTKEPTRNLENKTNPKTF